MNRITAEKNWADKFVALGLNKKFDFIGRDWSSDHGRKVKVRCRTCGCEFLTWGVAEVLKGHQKHLLCVSCGASSDGDDIFARTDTAKKAAELYALGLEQEEIARKLGCSTWDVGTAAKKYKVVDPGRKYSGGKKANANRTSSAEKRLAARLSKDGFEYIGGYTSKNSAVLIRCVGCGETFRRAIDFLNRHDATCPECRKAETRKRQAERKKNEAEIRALEKEWFRLLNPPRDFHAEQHEAYLDRSGICEICGKEYTVREYVESCGLKMARDCGVCSIECKRIKLRRIERESKKRRGVNDNDRHRAKKYGCAYDPSITLKKLVERDGLRCAICGGMCDWNDLTYSGHCGPTYPSKDHIIPLAKGGTHTWDNMQVAHFICNSRKGDRLEAV